MKQRFITAVLLSSIITFAVASWGRVVEWWEDMSPGWKSGVFMFCWALLILIGYRYGPYYALAALIAGLMFMAVQIGILIREMLNLIENNEKD